MKRTILVLLLLATPVLAHDTWIAPEHFSGACGAATLHMTSGMVFETLEYAIDPARVSRAIVRVPGRQMKLDPPKWAAHALDYVVNAPEKGIAIVAVELAPKTLELTPAQVEEYLDEIAAPKEIRDAWKAKPGRWRERYTKHAKTFLRCAPPAPGDEYQTSTDMGLELIPQGTDPTTLKSGDTFRVILTTPKRLVRDVPLVLIRKDKGVVAVMKPDKAGIFSMTLKEPGRYLLTATQLRRGDGKEVDWVSDFTTMTFEVAP